MNESPPIDDVAARIRNLLRQQAAIAEFGSFALRQGNLLEVLTEAARVCADGLDVPFCKVCQYRPTEDDLLIVAGFGWKAGVVGHVISRADVSSPQGRAFVTGLPSVCSDLRIEGQFNLPSFYDAHGIISTIDVVIRGKDKPYGVLEIDNNRQHDYDQHDINFLTGFANVLAEAVATAERTKVLELTIHQMQLLVMEKDQLLAQKKDMAEELQHRVRNNLQLVYGMLNKQVNETQDADGKKGVKAIARRVSTLAQVYDHLLGAEMSRSTDFGSYLKALCGSLAEFQDVPYGTVVLSCDSEAVFVDLDVVTALGIVVTELITNSYDHAFPGGHGSIAASVKRSTTPGEFATMVISDNGVGFTVKSESKRHGIGLVLRLIEQIRGTINLEAGNGTIWKIVFPLPLMKLDSV